MSLIKKVLWGGTKLVVKTPVKAAVAVAKVPIKVVKAPFRLLSKIRLIFFWGDDD